MKMDMSAKPMDDDMEETNEGAYSQEQLDCMLKNYIEAKKIEADPALFAMVKDYALSKNKMVEEMFKGDGEESMSPEAETEEPKIKAIKISTMKLEPVKSLKELRKKANSAY